MMGTLGIVLKGHLALRVTECFLILKSLYFIVFHHISITRICFFILFCWKSSRFHGFFQCFMFWGFHPLKVNRLFKRPLPTRWWEVLDRQTIDETYHADLDQCGWYLVGHDCDQAAFSQVFFFFRWMVTEAFLVPNAAGESRRVWLISELFQGCWGNSGWINNQSQLLTPPASKWVFHLSSNLSPFRMV